MVPSEDFFTLLSGLLQQIARNPDSPPVIPVQRWPSASEERRLLEDLQAATAALLLGRENHNARGGEREQQYRRIYENANDGFILNDLDSGLIVDVNPAACKMYGYPRQELIGQPFHRFIHPDSAHQFTQYLQADPSQAGQISQQVHLRRNGAIFYAELSGAGYFDQGHSYFVSMVRDVSQRVQAENLLQRRVEARTREQSTLLEISQRLASALELQPGLILDQLRVIIDYEYAGLFKLEDTSLTALALRGPARLESALPFRIRLESPETLAVLFKSHQPVRIPDVSSDDPPASVLRSLLDDWAGFLLEGVQSWMWVPLAIKGRVIGVIGVAHASPNYFSDHHAGLALTVANQAAITMVNSELYEHAQTLAALQERQRLARNLHDAVNQSLFSAGLIAEVLPRLWEQDPEEGLRSLEDLRRLTRGAQADMRLLLAELRPSTLTDSELGDLLRLLGKALAGRTNIPIEVIVTGEGKLPPDVQVALYRLCQEALNNISKHAGATRVDIRLQFETGGVELSIQDDGQGFDPLQAFPGHYGLSMMRERAAAVGATLSILSQPEHGTKIIARWVAPQEKKVGDP